MSLFDRVVLAESTSSDVSEIVEHLKDGIKRGKFSPGVSIDEVFATLPVEITMRRFSSLLRKHADEIGKRLGVKGFAVGGGKYVHSTKKENWGNMPHNKAGGLRAGTLWWAR